MNACTTRKPRTSSKSRNGRDECDIVTSRFCRECYPVPSGKSMRSIACLTLIDFRVSMRYDPSPEGSSYEMARCRCPRVRHLEHPNILAPCRDFPAWNHRPEGAAGTVLLRQCPRPDSRSE